MFNHLLTIIGGIVTVLGAAMTLWSSDLLAYSVMALGLLATAIGGVGWWRKWRAGRSVDAQQTLVNTAERWPLIELRQEAINHGWNIYGGVSLDVLQLLKGLRQAGRDDAIKFSGRPHRSSAETLNRNEPLAPIENTHWQDFEIEMQGFKLSEDNFGIVSYKPRQNNWRLNSYNDLHANRIQATAWLESHKPPRSAPESWPDFKKWDCVEYELYKAACLFFDKEPALPMPPDAQRLYNTWRDEWLNKSPDYLKILASLDEAVWSGIQAAEGGPDKTFNPHMRVKKDELINWCESQNEYPRFLFPYRQGEP